ncbi:MAG: hypothetical protein K6T65_06210 [Peptococcaceae bacterium]|nr:hypothetical protein [Peptococcaceae bacterium]
MSEEADKEKAKMEGVDVSGYMPPGMGPGVPCPPGPGPMPPYPAGPWPGTPCPGVPEYWEKMGTLACKLKGLEGQQVTVYVMGMGPVAPVPVLPAGGSIITGSSSFGLTGILHEVGRDYLELHVDMTNMRVVYIPLTSAAAIVPGGPLMEQTQPGTVTTMPGTI